ncbi:MAG: hypothetical protein V1720_09810 [bacterium]
MKRFDLAVAYTWEYDEEFVTLIERIFHNAGLKTFIIHKRNVYDVEHQIKNNKIHFKAFFDRASDEDEDFYTIHELLKKKHSYIFNPHFKTEKAIDKAYMHTKLKRAGLPVPRTLIFPPFDEKAEVFIDEKMLNYIGRPFIIKPAFYSGGSDGVVLDGTTTDEIDASRKIHTDDNYLIQQKIVPLQLEDGRAWFRCFWLINIAVPTWWDDITHVYREISIIDFEKYGLYILTEIVRRIAQISKLDYFSTEIAISVQNEFSIIDYVNDQCDMRLKSNHIDGVPDKIVEELVKRILWKVRSL